MPGSLAQPSSWRSCLISSVRRSPSVPAELRIVNELQRVDDPADNLIRREDLELVCDISGMGRIALSNSVARSFLAVGSSSSTAVAV